MHPLWPPLPISLMVTSNYALTLTTTSTFTHGHFRLPTHFDHHLHFHTCPLLITHPLWPSLPFSHMATSDYTPTLTTTSIFIYSHFRLHTHIDHHFHFHTWPLLITHPLFHFHSWPLQIMYPLWPPLLFSHLATSDYTLLYSVFLIFIMIYQ